MHTLYFQGLFASQLQCSKYTGLRPLLATTGQQAICPKALDIVRFPYIGKELDEVVIHDRARSLRVGLLAYAQEKLWGIIDARDYKFSVQTPGKSRYDIRSHSIDFAQMNFGQDGDMHQLTEKYALYSKQHPDDDCILFGVSRGAAATCSAYAQNHYPNVKLVILEGCYDSLEHVLSASYQSTSLHSWVLALLKQATAFKSDGISPIASIQQFPADTPVVFVHSKQDTRVPYECAYTLATALAARGKNPVWFLTLEHSTHSRYHSDNQIDAEKYTALMHALYQKYNLPHIPEYAHAGQQLMQSCLMQPK